MTGVYSWSIVMLDIGSYMVFLAMNDGPLGGEVVGAEGDSCSALQLVQTSV